MPTREYAIELEVSLWSLNESEFPLDPLFFMQRAFEGDIPPIVIRTSPKHQERFGGVRVARGRATVSFYFQWKDPVDLAGAIWLDHIPNRAELAYAIDQISLWCMEATWEITRDVEAETFDELMERIDEVETDLMELERRQANAFDALCAEIVKTIKDSRV